MVWNNRSLLCLLCWTEKRMMSRLIGKHHRMLLLLLLLLQLNHCHFCIEIFMVFAIKIKYLLISDMASTNSLFQSFIAWQSSINNGPSSFAYLSKIWSLWDWQFFLKMPVWLSSSPFLLLSNLGVDEVLGVDELPSTSVKILSLASIATSLILLYYSLPPSVLLLNLFVDKELEELSTRNFNGSTEAEPENKLECHNALAQFLLTHFFYHLWQHLKNFV